MPMRTAWIVAVFILSPAAAAQAQFPKTCADGTELPFARIAAEHPIDTVCPALTGLPDAPEASHKQNTVKNNFCASAPQPKSFTPAMLIDLQGEAKKQHVSFGHDREPDDRSPLDGLGEGSLVRMKAYLIESHYADLGDGESVNCDRPAEEDNDIHIALGPEVNTLECASVSAEISPHFRPAAWTAFGTFENFKAGKYTVDPQVASRLKSHPYRITGQLFFDASHVPCPCGTRRCSPSRSSLWEIHPVYKIEVCRAGAACDEANDGDWMDFDTWWNSLAPIQHLQGPHSHTAHEPRKPKAAGGAS